MRWGVTIGVTVLVILIVLFELPALRQKPLRDKIAFFSLLLCGWALAQFDLPNMAGPITWLNTLFKPLGKWMEK
ncbi:hypothetical protein ABE205_03510 [Brevibacillus agri]|uniref:hypothetical protein n=1 Tax=Brevibacillus agri TaxID=51101 RepID=UPI001C8E6C94|nr:hypothetical protein [Brevibacillus agri]MBY0050801.1 hypothetical protein [Brevibacillus agri]